MLCYGLILIIVFLKALIARTECPADTSNGVLWPETNEQASRSIPLCIKNLIIYERECTGDKYVEIPNSTCTPQPEIPECPDNLISLNSNTCFALLTGQKKNIHCPYPGQLSFNSYIEDLESNFKDILPVWLPVLRSDTYKLLLWNEVSSKYMDVVTDDSYYFKDTIQDKDCVIYYNKTYSEAVFCNETHNAVCAYEKLHQKTSSLCPGRCLQSSYSSTTKCFCKTHREGNLAEFLEPYQNLIGSRLIRNYCYIGLEYKSYTQFNWTTSKTSITYTNWAKSATFQSNYGAITPEGWILRGPPQQGDCYLSEINLPVSSGNLKLKFLNEAFYVTVNNDLIYENQKPLLYCFSDVEEATLFTKFEVSEVAVNSKNDFYFSPLNNNSGNYWCAGFTYPDYSLITSSTYFLNRNHNEYIGLIQTNYQNLENPFTKNYLESLSSMLSGLLAEGSKYRSRLVSIESLNELDKKIITKWHFTSEESTAEEQEFLEFKTFLKTSFSTSEKIEFILQELFGNQKCYTTSSLINNQIIIWPTTSLNEIAHPVNTSCLTSNLIMAFQTCLGDDSQHFLEAKFTTFTESCTTFEHSAVTGDLIDASNSQDKIVIYKTLTKLQKFFLELTPLDLYYLSEIFKVISNLPEDVLELDIAINIICATIDGLGQVSEETLKESQFFLATDRILFHFDKIVQKLRLKTNLNIVKTNFLLIGRLLKEDNFSGLALKGNLSLSILRGHIDLATLQDIESLIVFDQLPQTGKQILVLVFLKDYLFDNSYLDQVKTPIFKIFSDDPLIEKEVLIFYNTTVKSVIESSCMIWNLQDNELGFWNSHLEPTFLKDLVRCNYLESKFNKIFASNNLTASLQLVVESHIPDKLNKVSTLTSNPEQITDVDVSLVATILKQVVLTNLNISENVFKTISNLLNVDKKTMVESQVNFQSTNKILSAMDKIYKNSIAIKAFKDQNYKLTMTQVPEGTIGCIVDFYNNTCGITFLFESDHLTEIFSNPDFKTALLFNDLHLKENNTVLSVISNDVLFNQDKKILTEPVTTSIISIYFPLKTQQKVSFSAIYNTRHFQGKSCSIWERKDYKNGNWKTISNPEFYSEDLIKCNFYDETYFTLQLKNEKFNITSDLQEIFESDIPAIEKQKELAKILEESYMDLVPYDIFLVSEIFRLVAKEEMTDLNCTSLIVADLMKVSGGVLEDSQKLHGATDRVLYFLDKMLMNFNDSNEYIEDSVKSYKIVIYDLIRYNYSGVVLENCLLENCQIALFETFNQSMLEDPTLDAVVLFSEDLLNQLRNSSKDNFDSRIIISVFFNNSLFRENSGEARTTSKLFSILFPNIQEPLQGSIKIMLRSFTPNACGFWDYSVNSNNELEKPGSWNEESSSTSFSNLSVCTFNHVTHFGLLLTNDPDKFKMFDDFGILDQITNVNCILSAIGIVIIALTGVIFKRWRQNTGNIILLNFCFAISIKMIMLYVSDALYSHRNLNITFCTISGALLHYAVLSEFYWMLVIAILQFKRFVEVLGGPPKYILMKACVCGWGLPVIPVVLVLIIDLDNYVSSKVGLCYPTDLGLYLGVWLPVIIVVIINLVIFSFIMYNVCHQQTECRETTNNETLFQWRLALLLFFMLGLTWLFGFLAQIDGDISYFFIYAFCLTASLQGFIMFLFFILFNKSTRLLYTHAFKLWLYSKNLKSY